jgi:hypothetical protein
MNVRRTPVPFPLAEEGAELPKAARRVRGQIGASRKPLTRSLAPLGTTLSRKGKGFELPSQRETYRELGKSRSS